jgi:RNA polymerase sigma-70 factor (ECF subfamily)
MKYTTHTTLLTRVSKGVDPDAWKDFSDRYLELIRGFAIRYGLQAADCDDVAQEVLLALSKSMTDFIYDPTKGKFRSYLKTVTLRMIFQNLRQKKGQRVLSDIDSAERNAYKSPDVEELWEKEWEQYHVRQAMKRIASEFNEQDRLAFSLYVVKNRPAAETAQQLGLSMDQVYQAKSRILKRLGQLIDEQVKDEG